MKEAGLDPNFQPNLRLKDPTTGEWKQAREREYTASHRGRPQR